MAWILGLMLGLVIWIAIITVFIAGGVSKLAPRDLEFKLMPRDEDEDEEDRP
jgi:hypothetical protein